MSKSCNFFKTIVISFIIMSFNHTSIAQVEYKAKKNSIKMSPTAFFASTFAVSYERYIAESFSMQFTGGIMAASKDSYTYYNGNGYSNDNSKDIASGGLADISFRFFFLKGQSVMSGLYAGPYGRYSKNTFEIHTYNSNVIGAPTSFKYNIESYEGGALFGWQWIIKNAFVMDMYVGGGLKISNNNAPNYYNTNDPTFYILESQDYTGITPKAGFRLGFVF